MKPTESPVMAWTAKHALSMKPAPLHPARYSPPSAKELAIEILRLKKQPMTAKQIGNEIGYSANTVRNALKDEKAVRWSQTNRDAAKLYEAL